MQIEESKSMYLALSRFDKELFVHGFSNQDREAFWSSPRPDLARKLFSQLSYGEREAAQLLEFVEACRQLQANKNPFVNVADDIYELMLISTRFWVERPDYVCRGHGDEHWELIPSWYRSPVERDIQLYETAMNSRYQRIEQERVGTKLNLSPFEREAVVQHYGSSTLLIDVTESIRIAAFFATFTLDKPLGTRGRLYILKTARFKEHGFSLLRASQIPKEFTRIHTTKGCFLQSWERGTDFDDSGYLSRFTAGESSDSVSFAGRSGLKDPNRYTLEMQYIELGNDVWEFHFAQTAEIFTDPFWGVTQHQLDY